MKEITAIIFDLGGVLLDVDFALTEKAFHELGVVNFNQLYNQHKATTLFEDLETGKISPEVFYEMLRTTVNQKLTNNQIENAWCALLGKFEIDRLNWLEEIATKYKIYLFSNTNKIHYDSFQKTFTQQTGKATLNDYFLKAWYSHEVGFRKPAPEAFEKVMQMEALHPSETLFIDDTISNIKGAAKAGMQTIWLPKNTTVTALDL